MIGRYFFGNLGIATGGDGEVIVATLGEASLTTPVISDDFCAGPNRSLNEVAKRLRATGRANGEPDTTGVSPTLALVELGPRLSLADLNGRGDKDFIMDASAFSVCSPSDRAFVDCDVLAGIAAYPILIWAHHAGAELMENLEGRLVTGDAQLPLKLHGRHPWRLTGYQIGSPEPAMPRRMRTFHHRPHRQSCVPPTAAASQDTWDDLEIAADRPRTRKRGRRIHRANAVSAGTCAGFVIREKPLELWKRVRERKIVALMNVHEHDSAIIRSIIEGNNRIGMLGSIAFSCRIDTINI